MKHENENIKLIGIPQKLVKPKELGIQTLRTIKFKRISSFYRLESVF